MVRGRKKGRKRPKAKPRPAGQVISFRPEAELAHLVEQVAENWRVSSGEAVRRIVSLDLRGFNMEMYPLVCELADLLYAPEDFDAACHQLRVAIHIAVSEKEGRTAAPLPPERTREEALRILERYRLLRGLEEKSEHQKMEIRIVLTSY